MRYSVIKNAAIKGRFYAAGAVVELIEAAARKYQERGLIRLFDEAKTPIPSAPQGETKTPPEVIAEDKPQAITDALAVEAKQTLANNTPREKSDKRRKR